MSAQTSSSVTYAAPARQAPVELPHEMDAPRELLVLTDVHVAELLAARDAVRLASLPLLAVRRADFPLPTLGQTLARLSEEIDGTHGSVVVRGVPVEGLCEADVRLVLWGIGLHLGTPVSQDRLGRLLAPEDTSRSDFHSGGSDVTALLVRGEPRTVELADSRGVVDDVVRRHPYLAVRMFDTWPHDRMGEQLPGERAHRSTALACRHDGRRSLRYDRPAIERAQRHPGVRRLEAADVALLDLVDEAAAAPARRRDVRLVAGDLLLVNNYEVLHRHVEHPDVPGPQTLRLWITLPAGRALPATFTWATPANGETRGRGGVAPRDVIDPHHTRGGRPAARH
jgi:Taurine catabolism dioxygenase TauD, TfdA family